MWYGAACSKCEKRRDCITKFATENPLESRSDSELSPDERRQFESRMEELRQLEVEPGLLPDIIAFLNGLLKTEPRSKPLRSENMMVFDLLLLAFGGWLYHDGAPGGCQRLGKWRFQMGDFGNACTFYEWLVKLKPNDPVARGNLETVRRAIARSVGSSPGRGDVDKH